MEIPGETPGECRVSLGHSPCEDLVRLRDFGGPGRAPLPRFHRRVRLRSAFHPQSLETNRKNGAPMQKLNLVYPQY